MRPAAALSALCWIALSPMCAPAQSRPDAEDILRWFPEGSYEVIEHEDLEAMGKADAYSLYYEYFLKPLLNTPYSGPLPSSLRFGYQASTYAKMSRDRVTRLEGAYPRRVVDSEEFLSNLKTRFKHFSGVSTTATADGAAEIVFVREQVRDELWVFLFPALDLTMQSVLAVGDLDLTGYTIGERPVYTMRGRTAQGSYSVYWAYAAPTGELALALELEHLEAMVEAGMNQGPNILDMDDYEDLERVVPELGQQWTICPFRTGTRQRIERLEEEHAAGEQIDTLAEELESGAAYGIDDLHVENDEIRLREITIFRDEDEARKAERRESVKERRAAQSRAARERKWWLEQYHKKKETSRFDIWVIVTFHADREFLEARRNYDEFLARMKEQSDAFLERWQRQNVGR